MTVINLRNTVPPNGVASSDIRRIDRLTKYGNPFHLDRYGNDRALVLRMYRDHMRWVLDNLDSEFLEPLRGKVLACWCKPLACHGDVIEELLRE